MFRWWRARVRRPVVRQAIRQAVRQGFLAPTPARRTMRRRARRGRVGGPSLVLVATLAVSVGVLAGAPAAHAGDDDLRPRLEAACARIPVANERVNQAIARLDGPADQRGSLAWFEAAVARATANDRPRIAADLQRRLDRLTDRRALLDVRVSQLERLADRCVELGAGA